MMPFIDLVSNVKFPKKYGEVENPAHSYLIQIWILERWWI